MLRASALHKEADDYMQLVLLSWRTRQTIW